MYSIIFLAFIKVVGQVFELEPPQVRDFNTPWIWRADPRWLGTIFRRDLHCERSCMHDPDVFPIQSNLLGGSRLTAFSGLRAYL